MIAAAHRHYGVTMRETVGLDKHPVGTFQPLEEQGRTTQTRIMTNVAFTVK